MPAIRPVRKKKYSGPERRKKQVATRPILKPEGSYFVKTGKTGYIRDRITGLTPNQRIGGPRKVSKVIPERKKKA